jgi:hypothetical protein
MNEKNVSARKQTGNKIATLWLTVSEATQLKRLPCSYCACQQYRKGENKARGSKAKVWAQFWKNLTKRFTAYWCIITAQKFPCDIYTLIINHYHIYLASGIHNCIANFWLLSTSGNS